MANEEKTKDMLVTSTGYCYSDLSSSNPDIQTPVVNPLHSFESNPEVYSLTTGMKMIGFPPKNSLQQQSETYSVIWQRSFNKPGNQHPGPGGPSYSKTVSEPTSSDFYQHEFNKVDLEPGISETTSGPLMVTPDSASWHESRLLEVGQSLSCVFPCEGNERPSQGLSLSLSSSNPSGIGLQSFEPRQPEDMRFLPFSSRDGSYGKSLNNILTQQQMMQNGFLGKAANLHYHHQEGQFQIRNSKYLAPVRELLNEFCNLGTKQSNHPPKLKLHNTNQWQEENACSSSKKQSLYSLELLELQKRKTKLLQLLEEVDRRYKHYYDQMKAVVSSFEAVAGNGAATVYSSLASKAMSRHFRWVRDGIVGQIKAAKNAMGEKDPVAPGTTRGETPRLRHIDQTLRQQRAFQQLSTMESHPWRPQRGLPERSVSILRAWLFEHFLHPYPSDVDKHVLARQTGLSRSQVSNWFINARVRLWKPMVEEMYLEETKEQNNVGSPNGVSVANLDENGGRQNQSSHPNRPEDQKPTHGQLIQIDSECLSSIITSNPDRNVSKASKSLQDHQNHHLRQSFGRVADSFGAVELDFSSDNFVGGCGGGFGDGSSGAVSLTLGLQQHGGSHGVSLAFTPASQSSLFYPRGHIDQDCQPVRYSIFDGEGQNLPYRSLMGAQLLHDLTG